MAESFVPFSAPDIGEEEVGAVREALLSGWVTSGPVVKEFEAEFARACGAKRALAVNSCTAGLHLALAAAGIGPGMEVITTPLTFCATVNTILQVGAKPVLADVGSDLNIDPDRVAAAITPQTAAIVPVHFAGLPCEMDAIWSLADRYNLRVIEDAAHAAGAKYKQTSIGAGSSDAVAFSFYATKNLTTGEGGMVTTPSRELYERMRVLCLHGISQDAWNRYSEKGHWHYEVIDCGFKYNLSDILAAIGRVQLKKLERMNARRAQIAARYNQAFAGVEEVELPPDRTDCRHAWQLYVLRLRLDRLTIDRARFFDEMRERGIGCSVHFIPIPLHPYYRRVLELRDPCVRALREYPRLVSLPMYSSLSDGDAMRVIRAVQEIALKYSRVTARHNRNQNSADWATGELETVRENRLKPGRFPGVVLRRESALKQSAGSRAAYRSSALADCRSRSDGGPAPSFRWPDSRK